MIHFIVRSKHPEDNNWIRAMVSQEWGSEKVISKGITHYPPELPGFVAFVGDKRIGFATYLIHNGTCEIVTLASFHPGYGIGTSLIEAVIEKAKRENCKRLFLTTTNNNAKALNFYKNRGFKIVKIHKDAVKHSRILKPEIPLYGENGVEIKDEIELDYNLYSTSTNK